MEASALKRLALFSDFGDEDREHVAELLDEARFAEGDVLFREGDEADAMLLIVEGTVRITSESAGKLGLLCEGASLGHVSLVAIGKREASAIAESETRVAILDRASFLRLADDFPRTAGRLAEAMVIDLAATLRGHLSHVKQRFSSDDVVLSG